MADLITFFSRKDENYVNGTIKKLEVGNTEAAATVIQHFTGAPMFMIEPLLPYSADYNECISQAQKEQSENARPELKRYPETLEHFDTIYLGYPNYWGTIPMPVFTYLEYYDFKGKVIRPFCTHEGSGFGNSLNDIKRLCPGAIVEKGLAIRGGAIRKAGDDIREWIQQADSEASV